MRRGIQLFVALAIVGCASEKFSGTQQASSPTAGGNVNGTWAATWPPLEGQNTYPDTLKTVSLPVKDSIVTRTVRDSCTAAGTLVLTQAASVAYVTGPDTVKWVCTSIILDTLGKDSVVVGTVRDSSMDSVRNANFGSGELSFSIDKSNAQLQLGLVNGKSMSGSVKWTILLRTRPNKAKGTVFGTFSATTP
jgi:hypothetical protein